MCDSHNFKVSLPSSHFESKLHSRFPSNQPQQAALSSHPISPSPPNQTQSPPPRPFPKFELIRIWHVSSPKLTFALAPT
ncbi:MAG: hypothetical protein ACTS47_01830 [Candidatus Hodgkinia cicadicola]